MVKPNYKTPSQSNTTTPFWTNPQINKQHQLVTMFAGHIGTTSYSFNLNQQEDDEEVDEQQFTDDRDHLLMKEQDHVLKEHMFQKTLTPSDVGKLNRLVIPKQQAEKYFPLGGVDPSSEKRLLLSFEDESGKLWRFRYSYWNSSQSYVLTKGWSRYVKEKQLDAGDIVVFERYRVDGDRLFIGWRRSGTTMAGVAQAAANGGGRCTRAIYSEHPYPSQPNGPPFPYKPHCLHAGTIVQNQTGSSSGNSKRLRLFGVNFECQSEPKDSTTDIGSSISSSHGEAHYRHYYPHPHASDHHNNMDINFPRDVN